MQVRQLNNLMPISSINNKSTPINYDDVEDVLNGNAYQNNDNFWNGNGLHDYKERYSQDDDFDFTPAKVSDKPKKPHFLSQQPKRNDFNGYGNNLASESKFPPSLKWAIEEDGNELGESPLMYERNSKATANLAPINNGTPSLPNPMYKNNNMNIHASAGTIYGESPEAPIERIPSIKKLSSQKTRRLQPLRK